MDNLINKKSKPKIRTEFLKNNLDTLSAIIASVSAIAKLLSDDETNREIDEIKDFALTPFAREALAKGVTLLSDKAAWHCELLSSHVEELASA